MSLIPDVEGIARGETAVRHSTRSRESIKITEPFKTKPFIILVACCAALGGLIFGYDLAGAGATFVMPGFKEHFGWSCASDDVGCTPMPTSEINFEKGMINAFFGIGATVGSLVNPYIADKIGRRLALVICNFVFILGAAIQASAPNMNVMWAGRFIAGTGIGMLSMVVPVYIAECSPEHVRGRLGTLWVFAITIGILVASACNIGLRKWNQGWRISYGGNILFSVILLFSLIFMPESPRWLAANASEEEVIKALKKTRYENEIEREIEELRQETEEEKRSGSSSWKELFSNDNRMMYRTILGMSLQLTLTLSGILSIMFYAPDILHTFFTPDQALIGTFVLNIINFLSTFITFWAIDRFGRVKTLTSGGIIMCAAMISNAVLSAQTQSIKIGYLVIVSSAFFIMGFAYSWGPVVWVLCSEMFPLRYRGKATGLTAGTHWVGAVLLGAVFPAASTASLSGCFIFFAVVISLGVVNVHLFQVETSNKTILEIDDAFASHKPKLRRWKYADERDKRPLVFLAGSLVSLKENDLPVEQATVEEDGLANPSK